MERRLSEEDRAFRDELREFFTTAVPQEVRDRWAAGGEISKDDIVQAQHILNERGIAVPGWPVDVGGQDWSDLRKHIWHEEMMAAHVPPPLAFNATMVGPVIAQFGTEEQKKRFLPGTASLDIWWCQGFSEPGAGSDLASLRTTAVKEGDEYVINGQKTWTTLGQHADWIFVLARTDPNAPKKQQGISFLLVEMSTPGIEVRPIQLLDGGHEVNEVFFDDVRVPADQLVGKENDGWTIAKFLLGNERTGVAPVASIKGKLLDAKERAAQIPMHDGTLADDPLTAARIAELEAQVYALELTVLRVAAASRDGRPDPASSILKLRGSQLQQEVTELMVDIAGPASLEWERDESSELEAWTGGVTQTYLNFRKASIYGGSNEVQRQIIAGQILGLKG